MQKECCKKAIKKKDKIIQKQQIRINQLERKLLLYENPHTPPSKKRTSDKKDIQKSGKLGAKKGHPKYTRPKPIPDKTIIYDKISEEYQNRELAFLGQKVYYEEEIPRPQKPFVTKYVINLYLDINNGTVVVSENNAPKGAFGKNVETHITLLKFADRLPLRKVTESLQRQHNLKITNVGVYNVAKRVSRKLNVPYNEIIKAIRSSDVLYIDETQIKVNGKSWWLWVFVSEKTILFVLRDSRGKEVIEEILGKRFEGKISADGWNVYKNFATILQRCWAHLLRECKELLKNHKKFKSKNNKIHKLFDRVCNIRDKPPPLEIRLELKKEMEYELEDIGKSMIFNSKFKKLGTKILNGLDSWFTCIEHLDIAPTNNFAEQALREPIVQRKIFGGLRSNDGARVFEVILSCIATWKKQNKPLFTTLKNHL